MAKKEDPKSAVGSLMMFIDNMDLFLHPRIMEGLKKAVWDARTEMAKEVRDQKFSQELQELEPVLQIYKQSVAIYKESRPNHFFHLRPVIRKIIELYGTSCRDPQY